MIYILFGEDEARSRYKLETLKKNTPHDVIQHFDLNEDSQETILDAMDTFSLFGDQTMIIVDNASFLASEKKTRTDSRTKSAGKAPRKKNAKKVLSPLEQQLEAFARRDPDDKTIVYMVPAKTISKAGKNAFPSAQYIESKPLDEKSISGVIDEMIRERHLHLDPDAKKWFETHVGLNTLKISSELDKLALFSDHISLADMQALVIPEPSENVFAMTDALFEKRILDLIDLYRQFRSQNMEPVAVNGLLASQIRFVYQVRVLMDLRFSQQDIASRLGVTPGRVYYTMKKARRFSADKLLSYLDTLSELDWKIKSGQGDKDAEFEDFFLRLLQDNRPALHRRF